jgi:hypothetical protein
MQEYDVALKLLLRGSAKLTMRELTGTAIEKWLNVELPKVQNRRMDLLGETAEGRLVRAAFFVKSETNTPAQKEFGGLPHLGQCMLLSRRLIEAGVRLVGGRRDGAAVASAQNEERDRHEGDDGQENKRDHQSDAVLGVTIGA